MLRQPPNTSPPTDVAVQPLMPPPSIVSVQFVSTYAPPPLTASLPTAVADVALQRTDDALARRPSTTDAPTRHCRYPSDSDADENPPPCTVRGAPPSDAPRDGHTDDTDADDTYVNSTPPDEN